MSQNTNKPTHYGQKPGQDRSMTGGDTSKFQTPTPSKPLDEKNKAQKFGQSRDAEKSNSKPSISQGSNSKQGGSTTTKR